MGGMGLGLSMQIDAGVMLVQFAVLLRSILFDKKLNGRDVEDQNKINFWKNIKKNLDEINMNLELQNEVKRQQNEASRLQNEMMRRNIAAEKEFMQILMRRYHARRTPLNETGTCVV